MIYGNTGGGMTLLDSQMAIQGRVELFENSAVYGGGLVMSGRSLVNLPAACGELPIAISHFLSLSDRNVQR